MNRLKEFYIFKFPGSYQLAGLRSYLMQIYATEFFRRTLLNSLILRRSEVARSHSLPSLSLPPGESESERPRTV